MMYRQREECDRVDRVSGETCVTVCIAVRGIQRGRITYRQREECDRQRGEIGKWRKIVGKTLE
jgi:hypothetical protein